MSQHAPSVTLPKAGFRMGGGAIHGGRVITIAWRLGFCYLDGGDQARDTPIEYIRRSTRQRRASSYACLQDRHAQAAIAHPFFAQAPIAQAMAQKPTGPALTETTTEPAEPNGTVPSDHTTDPAPDTAVPMPAAAIQTELPLLAAIAPTDPEPAEAPAVEAVPADAAPVEAESTELAMVEAAPAEAAPGEPAVASSAPVSDADQPVAADAPEPVAAQAAEEPASDPSEPDDDYPAEPEPEEAPRTVFADLGLSPEIVRAIEDMGYRHPTPIQEQAIPVVLMGRDVMGVAQTGTGKTAGFTLPMLDILSGSRARARMPRSLILEPTRELALQVAENFVQYGKYLKLTHALIIGGESMSDQKDVLNRGVDVLIATPGRLIDMFERGSILLSDAKLLVIDEADRMLDMGFIPDVERIVSLLPPSRQTLFFSATMGPEIRRLADAFLQNPKEITVSRPASVATTITEGLALVSELDKREVLRRLIRKHDVQNALIFCNRKSDVDILYKSLTKHRFSVGALHGDMAQSVRFSTLEKFKAGEIRLLVCSDVAARGIDIGGLSHVFNFDVPHHAEDYVHRIGRTGRAGLEGHAYTIAKPDDRFAIEAIEKLINHPIPPIAIEGLDPVEWSEGDGRKRRGGRAKKAADPRKGDGRKGERDKPVRDRAPRMRAEPEIVPVAAEPEADLAAAPQPDRPRRERTPRGDDRPARRDEPRRDEARRDEPRRDEPRRDEPRREAGRRDEPRRDDSRRDEPRRDDFRRDGPRRFRRDDDLGAPVLGFGDDVPAFMLLRVRAPRPIETTETEA